jgi:3-oxoacyl-[acyl-carrier-protein] synthase-3
MSACDPIFGLHRAREQGRLRDGDLVVLLAAGTGYTWAATTVRWGPA